MKRLILLVMFLIMLTGCAINKPQLLKSNPNLPIVNNFKAYPDRNSVALRWSIVKNSIVKGYYIQRYNTKTNKWDVIAKIKNPYKSIYVDTDLKPSTTYLYKIATFNKIYQPSLGVKVKIKTLPTISQVIPLEIRPLKKGMIKLIFRPHINERVEGYIIQRKDKRKWVTIAKLEPRFNVEYIDSKLKDGKYYEYRVIAYSFDGLTSKPSKVLGVSTYTKPPAIIDIYASTNLPKMIKLSWKKVKGAVFYKVYEKTLLGYTLLAKTSNNYYIDKVGKDGYEKEYKVTAVSKYETESDLKLSKSIVGKSLPLPATPAVEVIYLKNKVKFRILSPDKRAVLFKIVKKDDTLFAKPKVIFTNKNVFIDKLNKKTTIYEFYAIDKYKLQSEPKIIKVQ